MLLHLLLPLLPLTLALPASSTPSALLISRTPPSRLSPCFQSSYYGSFGSSQEHIYIPTSCLEGPHSLDAMDSGSLAPLPQDVTGRIIWVGQAGVEGATMGMDEAAQLIVERSSSLTLADTTSEGEQHVMSVETADPAPLSVLHQSATSLLLHVPLAHLPLIDTLLPAHLVPVALPLSPLPLSASAQAWEPVPSHFARHLANLTKHLSFDARIDAAVGEIELDEVRRSVRWLTGEAPSGIVSRHSFTEGARKAAHWIKNKVEKTGAECHLHQFMPGFSPNVICHYLPAGAHASNSSSNTTAEHVIFSAHYDSRGSFGNTRAPGGDDDGSGSGHLLGVADAIKRSGVKFKRPVTLAWFAGEEQGLFGSQAYAKHLKESNATVVLQVQADMLAYRDAGEPLQLGLPESIHLPEASYLIGNLSHIYSPELVVGRTAACCSDHQSFLSYGFPSTQVFERNGWILDPYYHNSGDVTQRENYDFGQVVSIAKVTMAALLTVAGFEVPHK